jgi:hypothetical protein
MIELKLDTQVNKFPKLWETYADAGYSNSGHLGFRAFVAAMIPGADVTGTTRDGLVVKFKDESDYTMFALRWA